MSRRRILVPEVVVMVTGDRADLLTRVFDVAVIGGGAAGLSAALVLGRVRRSVVVVDAGSPRNAPAEAMHGFLSRDGLPPTELLAIGRREVESYGGVVRSGEATAARRVDAGFEVTLDSGETLTARRLLVTTGLVDELPEVAGLRERWGRDVLHCPYCHGWEVRDQPVGILGGDATTMRKTLLFRQLTTDVVLFTHTAPPLTDDETAQLAAWNVRVVDGKVDSLEVTDDRLTGVRMVDGTVVPRRALSVSSRLVARSGLLESLGLTPVAHPLGVGEFVAADPTGRTEIPGVWVAGNVTDLMAQVITAAAAGSAAAAEINMDLVAEDTRRAVGDGGHDHDHGAVLFTREYWDAKYGAADRIWSGNPNPHLVTVASELAPGTALDVGSGEGGDAIWLGSQGWQVTAVDVSTVALDRAAGAAAEAGPEVAERIVWQQTDVLTWEPEPRRFDLVSAQFMQLPPAERESLHRRLAAAVNPGGTLLIVGHHCSDLETSVRRPHRPDLMFTAEEVAGVLDPDEWEITTSTPERQVADPEGRPVTVRDAVLRAVRRR